MVIVQGIIISTIALFIILGIDELMDMARTSINVLGNCLATAVIARWEGEFNPVPEPASGNNIPV